MTDPYSNCSFRYCHRQKVYTHTGLCRQHGSLFKKSAYRLYFAEFFVIKVLHVVYSNLKE